ncbi:MAG TPA: error-prone DNA polymerase [Terriglobales bacterium]|nr:error-prone DNA polymerase [Terriglobales bacterium]
MYVELHARSAFSFLEGASLPEELAQRCVELGLPAMALLDRDGVYGAPRFHLTAKKAGVRAHIGAEVTVRTFSPQRHGGTEKEGPNLPQMNTDEHGFVLNQIRVDPWPSVAAFKAFSVSPCLRGEFRLPLLAASRAGYQNLCRLITRMKLRAQKNEAAATEDDLAPHAAGLICLTGGEEGPLASALARGGMEEARRTLGCLLGIYGRSNVYVELQRHFDRAGEARNRAAVQLARSLGLPLLATNGVGYAQPEQREVLDVLTSIRHHRTLSTAGRLLARNSERHLKSAEEMTRLFADLPQAIAATRELSSRLEFTLNDLGYRFPRYPVPPGETMNSFLRARTEEGARARYRPYHARARRQIERELALIEKLDLAGYFLIVWDLVRYCREQGILVQGRGSAANSAVCYSLGITAVDPVGMDLLFERFLSEERGEWPDIDLDLPSGDARERVIQYLYRRYGERGAAMTANVITYRGRSAAREVGKALGFDPPTLDRLARLTDAWEYKDPADTAERRFRDAGIDLAHPRMKKFFQLFQGVLDLPRHLGQHSGGMVICEGELDAVVPLEPATMPGRVVVQWDKEDCADLGIIKVDLLGLGMMAALGDALTLIREGHGEEVDLAHLPSDDPAVYAALQQADTVGMFQVESRAQMSCLPRLRPRKFYDIVVEVALIRPGPIVGRMVHPYLKRRQGREPVEYPHASLEPVLARTLGVPIFQEQLLRMAMIAAGFTGGEAEELRRALGFKRSVARMREIEVKLRRGMERNGITGAAQDQIVQSISSFALYGFPESHAASFALLAYASAWIKCHYPAAFLAALLNNQPMGFYHPATLVKDAQRHGVRVLPADVTRSDWLCTLEAVARCRLPVASRNHDNSQLETRNSKLAVRLGLCYVKGLRREAAQALLRERARAPFGSVDDLAARVPELRRDELVTLAEIGALNSVSSFQFPVSRRNHDNSKLETGNSKLVFHRRDALWQVERAVRRAGPLLEGIREAEARSPLAPMNHEERLVADFRGTGLTVGKHPMAYRREVLDLMGVRRAVDLPRTPPGRPVRIAGCVIARQRPGTARGFLFLSLEDETGIANAIVTPDIFNRHRLLLVSESFLIIEGVLQNQDNVISVKAERVLPLSVTRAPTRSHDFH